MSQESESEIRVAISTFVIALICTTAAFPASRPQGRHSHSVEKRIAWLQERVRHHTYVCRKGEGKPQAFSCKAKVWAARELAQARQEKHDYDWAWEKWLPDKWARVGACETGYGKRPGNWAWDSGVYVSAFGIIRVAYNHFAHQLGFLGWDDVDPSTHQRHKATPREEWRVADAIEKRYSFSAWGCGRA